MKTIAVADPSKQETLVTEAEVDPMDAEQTWPTEEEIKQAEGPFSASLLSSFFTQFQLVIQYCNIESYKEISMK